MGVACAVDRNIKNEGSLTSYSFGLTCIPSYDKVYRDCQKHADKFEELKQDFKEARANLAAVINAELTTPKVFADAIQYLVSKYTEMHTLEQDSIQIVDKHPYLIVGGQKGSKLVNDLQPAIKFIMAMEQTRKELIILEVHILSDKRMNKVLFENYETNATKEDLEDFDKALGREIAKKNATLAANLALDILTYREELESTSALLPKYLVEKLGDLIRSKSQATIVREDSSQTQPIPTY